VWQERGEAVGCAGWEVGMAEFLYKELSYKVIGAAMEVHRVLGPGFLENVYQGAFERELALQNIPFTSQHRILVEYKDAVVADYVLDLVIDNKIVVELKAVAVLTSIFDAQLLSYLHASRLKVGLLFNFGEASLRHRRLAA
jgi:GxxExxY protein